jgi:hypothetical protein
LKEKCSFFEVESGFLKQITAAFKNAEFKGRQIVVSEATAKDNEDSDGGYSRKPSRNKFKSDFSGPPKRRKK